MVMLAIACYLSMLVAYNINRSTFNVSVMSGSIKHRSNNRRWMLFGRTIVLVYKYSCRINILPHPATTHEQIPTPLSRKVTED